MSHLNFKTINKLARKQIVTRLPETIFKKEGICVPCQKGKQVKASFIQVGDATSRRILELLHMDLFGPIEPVSLGGKKYALVVVDEYSRYTWIVFLSMKKETLLKLPELMKLLDVQVATNL